MTSKRASSAPPSSFATAFGAASNTTVAAAAVAVAVPTMWIGYRVWKSFASSNSRKVGDVAAADSWTNAQVISWLQSNHLSQQCVDAFRANDIDGSVLFQLESYHLSDMGVKKLKDRILFQKCVDAIRPAAQTKADAKDSHDGDSSSTDEEERQEELRGRWTHDTAAAQQPKPTAKSPAKVPAKDLQPKAPSAPPAIPHSLQRDAGAEDRAKMIHAIVMKLQTIYQKCSSDAFQNSDPETQLAVIRMSKAELAQIIPVVESLPREEVAPVLPLVRNLVSMLEQAETLFQQPQARTQNLQSPPQDADQGQQVTSQAASALQKLYGMLSGFMEAMQSSEALSLPSADKERLALNVSTQVQRILEISAALPDAEREELRRTCEQVMHAARNLVQSQPTAAAHPIKKDTHQEQPQPASVQFLIRRVRAIFEALKSDNLLELPSEERMKVITRMSQEVASIEHEAQHLTTEEQTVLHQVFRNVKEVISQLSNITRQEAEMKSLRQQQANVAEEREQIATSKPKAAKDESTNPVDAISNTIKQVLEVLKDPEFMKATPEMQYQVCTKMAQRLQVAIQEVSKLPPQLQQTLIPMIRKVSELVGTVLKNCQQAAQKKADAQATPDADPESLDSLAKESTAEFAAIIGRLKEIYELVSSEEFESAPGHIKRDQSKELIKLVNNITNIASGLPEKEARSVSELVIPLSKMLNHYIKHDDHDEKKGPQQPKAKKAAQASEAAAEPSGAFQTIVDSLQQVFSVVNSERFKAAPRQAQKTIASKLNQHVESMLPHLKELSDEEHQLANKFAEPLLQLLSAILSDEDGSESAPSENGTNPKKTQTGKPRERHVDPATTIPTATSESQDESGYIEIVSKLRSIVNMIQSDNFVGSPRDRRSQIAKLLIRELTVLQQASAALPQAEKQKILPQIKQVIDVLMHEMTPVEEVNENEDEEAEAGQDEEQEEEPFTENDDAGDERLQNFRKALEGIRFMRSKVLSFDELQEQLQLLDEIDAMGIVTDEEIQIREAFHKELEQSIAKVKRHHGIPDDDDEDDKSAKNGGADKKAAKPAGKNGPQQKHQPGVEQVLQAFEAINRALKEAKFVSTSQLVPITQMIEETLAAADDNNIPWRNNPQAVKLIGETLTVVQQLQEAITSAPPHESDIEKVLRSSLKEIQTKPPKSLAELGQYIEILDEIQELQDQLTREDLMAYQELQKAVLARHKVLSSRPQSLPNAEEAIKSDVSSPNKDLMSPKPTAVPPNTPAVKADDVPPALVREDDEEVEEEEGEEEGEKATEELNEEQELIARMLLQMIAKLQRQRFTNQELQAFEQIVARLRRQSSLHPQVCQILDVVEELLEIHRNQNDQDEIKNLQKEKSAAQETLSAEEKRSPSKGQSPKAPAAVDGATQATEDDAEAEAEGQGEEAADDEEGIPDGFANELSLLPRILERLQLKDFVENTTLFEIKCISKILTQLSSARDIQSNANLLEAIERAKVLFSEHMQRYNGTAKDAASVLCPTTLTGMEVEVEPNQSVMQYTVIGGEESEDYTINEAFLERLHENNSIPIETADPAIVKSWENQSRAIIFCVQQYPNGEENATALSELMMLHDVLDNKHGFDMVSIVDDQLSLEEATALINDAVASSPTRLLLYYHTPTPPCIAPAQHAVTFFDGSVLKHKDVMKMCTSVPRVTIVHDTTKTLEVVAAHNGKMSPYVSVFLTDGAAQIANTSRCWLFDGLFTPLVVELLGRDDERTNSLCPEDIVNFAVASLTSRSISLGRSYAKSSELAMVFWVGETLI